MFLKVKKGRRRGRREGRGEDREEGEEEDGEEKILQGWAGCTCNIKINNSSFYSSSRKSDMPNCGPNVSCPFSQSQGLRNLWGSKSPSLFLGRRNISSLSRMFRSGFASYRTLCLTCSLWSFLILIVMERWQVRQCCTCWQSHAVISSITAWSLLFSPSSILVPPAHESNVFCLWTTSCTWLKHCLDFLSGV